MQCNKGRWLRRVEVQIRVFQRQKGRGKFHAAQTKVRAVRDVFFSRSWIVEYLQYIRANQTAVRLWHFVRKFKSIIWLVQRSDFSFPLPCQYRFLLQPLNTHILVRDSIIVLFSFFQRAVKNTFVFAWLQNCEAFLIYFTFGWCPPPVSSASLMCGAPLKNWMGVTVVCCWAGIGLMLGPLIIIL